MGIKYILQQEVAYKRNVSHFLLQYVRLTSSLISWRKCLTIIDLRGKMDYNLLKRVSSNPFKYNLKTSTLNI